MGLKKQPGDAGTEIAEVPLRGIEDDLAWLDYFLERARIITADFGMSVSPELIKGDGCMDGGALESNIKMLDRLVDREQARILGSRRRD